MVFGTELLVWGVLPVVAACGAIALSVRAALRKPDWIQRGLTVAVVVASIFSLVILKRIFIDGAWPTAVPHLAIAASWCVVGVQRWMPARRCSPAL
jgi:hypothetical protein